MSTYKRIVSHEGARVLTRSLIEDSQWFSVMPLPDDNYEVTVRDEEFPRKTLAMYAGDFPPNPERSEGEVETGVGQRETGE